MQETSPRQMLASIFNSAFCAKTCVFYRLTSVMTPMRSMSRAGLRGSSLGVECPLGGEEEAKEEAVAEAVMEAPWWCIRARLRPSRLTLATRFSISSARSSVDSFSSWMSLGRGEVSGEFRQIWQLGASRAA